MERAWLNRSFRAPEKGQTANVRLKDSVDEDLTLFREMRKREKERNNLFLPQNADEFDSPFGHGTSPIFKIPSVTPPPTRNNDFLNSDHDKTDYDWLLTPPGTPLFPSLEMEHLKTVTSHLGAPKARPTARPTALKSRLSNPQPEPELISRSNPPSRQTSGGPSSRPSTPTARSGPTRTSNRKLVPSKPAPSLTTSSRSPPAATSSSKFPRSSTPTSRPALSSSSAVRSSTPTVRSASTAPPMKSTSRSSTPSRRPSNGARSSSPVSPGHPIARPGTWKPSEMPGFSLDVPPNLRTTIADRPPSAARGRPGAPGRVNPVSNERARRKSCSPARGRDGAANGMAHGSGGSVPVAAVSRLRAKANENVSPGLVGTKMVERVVNMRKLVPPKPEEKSSAHGGSSGKSSSSPDGGSGFGRTLSKKSLDMAIRHMDIRRTIPGNLRPLMTNGIASSMCSVRTVLPSRRTVSASDSPIATSSNASSEVSVSNNALGIDGHEADDDVSSGKVVRSPAGSHGR